MYELNITNPYSNITTKLQGLEVWKNKLQVVYGWERYYIDTIKQLTLQ